MRVTRRQLRQIIKEAVALRESIDVFNGETGELIELESEDVLGDMGITFRVTSDGAYEVSDEDFWTLDDHVRGKQAPQGADTSWRDSWDDDSGWQNPPDDLIRRARNWAHDAAAQFASGDYGVSGDLSNYAPDMARGVKWEFGHDEWQSLMDHFGSEWAVYEFVADNIVV